MAERFFFGALALYVIVLPIGGTTALRSIAFAALLGATIWQWRRHRLRIDLPLVPAWACYLAVALASVTYAADRGYALGEIKAEILYPYLVFLIAASWIRTAERLVRLLWLLAAGNLLFVVGSAWSAFQGKLLIGAWGTGVGATATVVAAVVPWLVILGITMIGQGRHRAAWFLGLLCIFNLGALVLTMNRQGWLALGVAFATAAMLAGRSFWTGRRTLVAALAACAFAALFALQFHLRSQAIAVEKASSASALETTTQVVNADVRWPLWRFSIERIAENPWQGGGFGRKAFDNLYRDYHLASGAPLWHAHNMVLNKGIQMGIPGIAAFLALWISLAAAGARGLRVPGLRPWMIGMLAMAAGAFTRNMVDDFFIRDHALLFWLLCGACLGVLRAAAPGKGTC